MKMNFKLFRMLLEILLLTASFCNAQRSNKCNPGSQCKPLSSCPQMLDILNSGIDSNLQIVRNNICYSVRSKTGVCCPTPLTSSATKAPEITIGHPAESVSLLPAKCGLPATEVKIINGSPALIGAFPWMAALGYTAPGRSKPSFLCAGSVINSKYVLTAAHCLDPNEIGGHTLSVIHLGDYDLTTDKDCERKSLGLKCFPPHIVAGVEDTVLHPKYNTRAKSSDDVALIRLNLTVDFDSSSATIQPVCLPPKGFNFRAFAGNRTPIAAGWGLTEHGNRSNILLRVNVPIANDTLCKERYKGKFVGNQLCIGGTEEGFDTCRGDSGGPLFMTNQYGPPFYQVGIVSFGPLPCGVYRSPGVYANVFDYRDWIINNLRP
ncbi:Serine protease easter [Armadillidium nasatum]|uniref:Serine protease easter n=1 Tax=Armadillidium nasatum TaxID=96803 RepID=A0A5N5SQY3_9CRUS|nr:Serine protease easter [Armadillidium nasatum]